MISNSFYPFTLEELPYPSTFLSEVLSDTMVILHHETHQNGYLKKLNAFLSTASSFNTSSLANLNRGIYNSDSLRKFAGGLYNHYLYWWTLTAPGCSSPVPTGTLSSKIEDKWGNFTAFKKVFDSESLNLFGSGWVWLCVNTESELEIRTTYYQLNPIMERDDECYPVLGNDLWEHAYYLRYGSDRALYVKSFWDMVDWSIVEMFYDKFARKQKIVPF
jgi:Fe-Mn family superoxide dismutase